MEVTEPYDFFIGILDISSLGELSLSSEGYINLEDTFHGLRYNKIVGIEKFGGTNNYVETFVEDDTAAVYTPSTAARGQNEVTLSLYFFDPDSSADKSYADMINAVETVYHKFLDFIDNKVLIYYDTARKRKVLMYQDGDIAPTKMVLKGGEPYFDVDIPFKTIKGHASIPTSEVYSEVTGDISIN